MMTNRAKPVASLSLDLDNQWSYMKTHGDDDWAAYPSYLDWVVPRILEFLERRQLKITFFIVGQDAALEQNHAALRSIADAGHEIGNHSFNHEPWLHLYGEQQLDKELADAENAIEKATGQRPEGFRGPGFSLSPGTLRALERRGYRYDATVFPNLLNPLARAYFFATSALTEEEKEQRKELFGTWRDALRPVKPFRWQVGDRSLFELPVTTMPVFKTPIHLSYIIYASRFSGFLARGYFRFAMFMCRATGTAPSMLLHPLDFMGRGEVPELDFFPGMDVELENKLALVDWVLKRLARSYDLKPVGQHVRATRLPSKVLDLVQDAT